MAAARQPAPVTALEGPPGRPARRVPAWCVGLAALLGSCTGSGSPPDAGWFVPDVQVDITQDGRADLGAPDLTVEALETTPETTPDTTPEAPDALPEATPDTPGPLDAFDTLDTLSAATCPTPSMMESFPPPLPPSPFGVWPPADGCVAAPHDVILVLGCPSQSNGEPSRCQERRAELADWLYEARLADHLIVSGAAVHTPFVEADALAALLVGRGVPEAAILREPLARHTDENFYYSTLIMQAHGWTSAIVVSDEPGHLVYTGLCDANCCVKRGRMTLWSFDVGRLSPVNAGHYALSPPGPGVTDAECAHLESLLLCTKLATRLACEHDFRLD